MNSQFCTLLSREYSSESMQIFKKYSGNTKKENKLDYRLFKVVRKTWPEKKDVTTKQKTNGTEKIKYLHK